MRVLFAIAILAAAISPQYLHLPQTKVQVPEAPGLKDDVFAIVMLKQSFLRDNNQLEKDSRRCQKRIEDLKEQISYLDQSREKEDREALYQRIKEIPSIQLEVDAIQKRSAELTNRLEEIQRREAEYQKKIEKMEVQRQARLDLLFYRTN